MSVEKDKDSSRELQLGQNGVESPVRLSAEEEEPVVTPKTWIVVFVSNESSSIL